VKIRGAKQVHYDSGPNMTPMVDVVMVILVFLMLAGSFGGSWHYLTSNLPITKKGGGEVKAGDVQDVMMEVRIDPHPTYGFRVRAGDIESLGEAGSLRKAFERKLAAYHSIGTEPDKIRVVLIPARNIRYEYITQVYQAALLAEAAVPGSGKPLKFTKIGFQSSSR
jgi:biopolymer transport protein ExbD